MLATYVYNHCNIYNIPIYFCNIRMKQLKHSSKITETLGSWTCNMSEMHRKTLEKTASSPAMTGQLWWRRLAGWCAPAHPRRACHWPREETLSDLGRVPPTGVGKGQRLAWARALVPAPVGFASPPRATADTRPSGAEAASFSLSWARDYTSLGMGRSMCSKASSCGRSSAAGASGVTGVRDRGGAASEGWSRASSAIVVTREGRGGGGIWECGVGMMSIEVSDSIWAFFFFRHDRSIGLFHRPKHVASGQDGRSCPIIIETWVIEWDELARSIGTNSLGPHLVPNFFCFCPSHQIFRRMHGALNIDEKN
jgi:hypothetical protein